ncbi:CHASE3 domain-containing protein [Flavisphingomonas formosensis]|uniref:CHASE3 domain-containing protein n=1 Tax=Flavisphingomonas formosensis TaxID=861534 RepID=UPI0012F8CD19|nr:CHASE3 domain-containing protein [Sphingomonas formosensis]
MATIRTPQTLPLFPLAGLSLIVLAVIGAFYLVFTQTRTNQWAVHSIKVEVEITQVELDVRTIESAHRGFLLEGDTRYLVEMERAIDALDAKVADLRRSTVDNPLQRTNVERLAPIIARKIAFARNSTQLYQKGDKAGALAMIASGEGRSIMSAVQAEMGRMLTEEERLFEDRSAVQQRITRLLAYGFVAAILLVATVAWYTIGDARRRFDAAEEARALADATAEALRSEMSAREEAESRVRQLQKMESVGQLTGGIAHDFNNMLAIVIGSLDLARRRLAEGPERVGRLLDNAHEGAERAAALTARLLAFSRQQPLAPVPIDANRLVASMSELLQRTLGEQIVIETVLAGGLWQSYADSSQLESAIVNLAVNARDAMPEGGRLTIETQNAYLDDEYARSRAEVKPGQYVLISVTDTGTGMSAEVIERAFDPFFTTKSVGKGTGLGLSQIFGFVKQSGGHVAIYSELGHGTTVKIYMPRYTGPALQDMQPPLGAELPMGSPDEIILVVEDEQRVRHFSVDALRELGYTAISAPSPIEALRMLDTQPSIALLFTDIVMPEMDGRRLADRAREMRPNLKVLYTTGYTRNAVVHNGMLDAGVAFLPKPFTVTQLAHKVRDVLDGGGANRPA